MSTLSMAAKELSFKYKIETLSVAVADKNGNVSSCAEGDEEHLFPLYSITKTFISVLLLKLAEENKVHLDDKVSIWIPDAPMSEHYSIRQLLNNTSGLPDYFLSKNYDLALKTHPRTPWTRTEYIQNTYHNKLLFDPGMGWAYSNLGYMFLKEIIEKLTAKKLSQAFDEDIFIPLNLKSCKVLNEIADWQKLTPATSVHLNLNETPSEVRGVYHPGWIAHGTIAATANDVASFFYHVFLGNFITAQSLKEMKTLVRVPGEHPPAVTPSYGLGLMGDPNSTLGKVYGHGGGGPGYSLQANFWESIKGGTTIIALGNNEHADMNNLALEIAMLYK